MKKLRIPIALASLYLLIYAISPDVGLSEKLTITMFTFSPFVVIGLVIWILKKGEPSDRKWSEGYFYEDSNIRSVPPDEES